MHFKALKIFCDVVYRRSFSRAADENGISQSGASQVVHQLECRLGVKLVDRSKRPFMLTPEGEVFYEGCRKLLDRYNALEEEVRTMHEEVAGRVRVASIYSVGLHHMSRYLQQFLSQYPKANVRLEYLHPHRVYEVVESDQADLGLVSYPKPSRSLQAIPWREEPMMLVCAPGNRFARRDRIELEEIAGQPIIGFDADLTIRREIDRVLHLHDVEVRVVMEFDNVETIKRAIEIDAGIGLLPQPTVVREVEAGTLVAVPLATDELVRPLGIIHRRGKDLGVTVRRFIDLLCTEGKGIGGKGIGDRVFEASFQNGDSASYPNGHSSFQNGDSAMSDSTSKANERETSRLEHSDGEGDTSRPAAAAPGAALLEAASLDAASLNAAAPEAAAARAAASAATADSAVPGNAKSNGAGPGRSRKLAVAQSGS